MQGLHGHMRLTFNAPRLHGAFRMKLPRPVAGVTQSPSGGGRLVDAPLRPLPDPMLRQAVLAQSVAGAKDPVAVEAGLVQYDFLHVGNLLCY